MEERDGELVAGKVRRVSNAGVEHVVDDVDNPLNARRRRYRYSHLPSSDVESVPAPYGLAQEHDSMSRALRMRQEQEVGPYQQAALPLRGHGHGQQQWLQTSQAGGHDPDLTLGTLDVDQSAITSPSPTIEPLPGWTDGRDYAHVQRSHTQHTHYGYSSLAAAQQPGGSTAAATAASVASPSMAASVATSSTITPSAASSRVPPIQTQPASRSLTPLGVGLHSRVCHHIESPEPSTLGQLPSHSHSHAHGSGLEHSQSFLPGKTALELRDAASLSPHPHYLHATPNQHQHHNHNHNQGRVNGRSVHAIMSPTGSSVVTSPASSTSVAAPQTPHSTRSGASLPTPQLRRDSTASPTVPKSAGPTVTTVTSHEEREFFYPVEELRRYGFGGAGMASSSSAAVASVANPSTGAGQVPNQLPNVTQVSTPTSTTQVSSQIPTQVSTQVPTQIPTTTSLDRKGSGSASQQSGRSGRSDREWRYTFMPTTATSSTTTTADASVAQGYEGLPGGIPAGVPDNGNIYGMMAGHQDVEGSGSTPGRGISHPSRPPKSSRRNTVAQGLTGLNISTSERHSSGSSRGSRKGKERATAPATVPPPPPILSHAQPHHQHSHHHHHHHHNTRIWPDASSPAHDMEVAIPQWPASYDGDSIPQPPTRVFSPVSTRSGSTSYVTSAPAHHPVRSAAASRPQRSQSKRSSSTDGSPRNADTPRRPTRTTSTFYTSDLIKRPEADADQDEAAAAVAAAGPRVMSPVSTVTSPTKYKLPFHDYDTSDSSIDRPDNWSVKAEEGSPCNSKPNTLTRRSKTGEVPLVRVLANHSRGPSESAASPANSASPTSPHQARVSTRSRSLSASADIHEAVLSVPPGTIADGNDVHIRATDPPAQDNAYSTRTPAFPTSPDSTHSPNALGLASDKASEQEVDLGAFDIKPPSGTPAKKTLADKKRAFRQHVHEHIERKREARAATFAKISGTLRKKDGCSGHCRRASNREKDKEKELREPASSTPTQSPVPTPTESLLSGSSKKNSAKNLLREVRRSTSISSQGLFKKRQPSQETQDRDTDALTSDAEGAQVARTGRSNPQLTCPWCSRPEHLFQVFLPLSALSKDQPRGLPRPLPGRRDIRRRRSKTLKDSTRHARSPPHTRVCSFRPLGLIRHNSQSTCSRGWRIGRMFRARLRRQGALSPPLGHSRRAGSAARTWPRGSPLPSVVSVTLSGSKRLTGTAQKPLVAASFDARASGYPQRLWTRTHPWKKTQMLPHHSPFAQGLGYQLLHPIDGLHVWLAMLPQRPLFPRRARKTGQTSWMRWTGHGDPVMRISRPSCASPTMTAKCSDASSCRRFWRRSRHMCTI